MRSKTIEQRQLELLAQAKNFFVDFWEKIVEFFQSYNWQEIIFDLKFIFIVISVLLLVLIICLILRISIISPLINAIFGTKRPEDFVLSKKKIKNRWDKIESKANSKIGAGFKLAVVEADKLFDTVLKNIGYGAEKKLLNIEEIKAAGKIKDEILKDKKYELSKEQAQEIIKEYKEGLKGLGMLE